MNYWKVSAIILFSILIVYWANTLISANSINSVESFCEDICQDTGYNYKSLESGNRVCICVDDFGNETYWVNWEIKND